jgi:hypothetical protein
MKNNNVRLNKIPISELVEALVRIYESGFDYVDIIGRNNVEQDVIGISFQKEYMSISEKKEENSIIKTSSIHLSEEDLNQLL